MKGPSARTAVGVRRRRYSSWPSWPSSGPWLSLRFLLWQVQVPKYGMTPFGRQAGAEPRVLCRSLSSLSGGWHEREGAGKSRAVSRSWGRGTEPLNPKVPKSQNPKIPKPPNPKPCLCQSRGAAESEQGGQAGRFFKGAGKSSALPCRAFGGVLGFWCRVLEVWGFGFKCLCLLSLSPCQVLSNVGHQTPGKFPGKASWLRVGSSAQSHIEVDA